MIELDQPQYIGFESTEMTEQICARLAVDLTQIVSLEDTFENLFGSPTATISATITSIQTNVAIGNESKTLGVIFLRTFHRRGHVEQGYRVWEHGRYRYAV